MNAIQKIRTDIGLSQQEFASRIGISQPAISQAESGKISIKPGTAIRIIELCQSKGKVVTLDDIYRKGC